MRKTKYRLSDTALTSSAGTLMKDFIIFTVFSFVSTILIFICLVFFLLSITGN